MVAECTALWANQPTLTCIIWFPCDEVQGERSSLKPIDNLLMAEIVWDLACEALVAQKAQEAERGSAQEARLPGGHNTVFSAERFAQAFPGVRGSAGSTVPMKLKRGC